VNGRSRPRAEWPPLKKKRFVTHLFDFRDFTSILCHAQYRRQICVKLKRAELHRIPAACA